MSALIKDIKLKQNPQEFWSKYFSHIFVPYIASFVIKSKVNPNIITLLMLPSSFLCLYLSIFIFNKELNLFLISLVGVSINIIDCVDGNISRIKNTATFYGKFLDGWVDIVIENFLILSLIYFYLVNLNLSNFEIVFFTLTIIVNLSFNFLLDRYHNFRRWANENKIELVYKSILNSKNLIINNFFNDLRYLFLILIIYDNLKKLFIFLFLSASILYSIHKTMLVLSISVKTLNLSRKSHHAKK